MCGERHVVNELLVSAPPGGDVREAVNGVMTATTEHSQKPLGQFLGLQSKNLDPDGPPGVALLTSKRNLHYRNPPNDPDHSCTRDGLHLEDLIDAGLGISPNYIMVQMYHGRVLPISFPRPAPPPAKPPPDPELGEIPNPVRVTIVDSPLIPGAGLDGVGGSEKALVATDPVPAATFHGTFIAGLVRTLEPRATVELLKMDDGNVDGFYSDAELAHQIMRLVNRAVGVRPHIISLSLGSVTDAGGVPVATEAAIRAANVAGIKVFAAAGNDGAAELVYPARFDGVHTVGAQAIDPGAEAPRAATFTNNPGAVDFWAPGVDVRSFAPGDAAPVVVSFRDGHHGHDELGPVEPTLPTADMIDVRFEGGACWSGCSVAVPIVAAICAKLMLDDPDVDPIPALRGLYSAENNRTSYGAGLYPVSRCNGNGQEQAAA